MDSARPLEVSRYRLNTKVNKLVAVPLNDSIKMSNEISFYEPLGEICSMPVPQMSVCMDNSVIALMYLASPPASYCYRTRVN